LGDILHDGHMEMVACLENVLLRRSGFHFGAGYQALDNTWWLGFLYGRLEFSCRESGPNGLHGLRELEHLKACDRGVEGSCIWSLDCG
jgi:hypothetical protein